VSYDFAEKDLAHIRQVLSHLEQSAAGVRIVENGPMASLDYWHARIRAILAMPTLSAHGQKQAKDLLARLERLKKLRRCTASS
jgi:ABC-type hemin transport system substrate-binding protein